MTILNEEIRRLENFVNRLDERARYQARLAIDDTQSSSQETMKQVYQAFFEKKYNEDQAQTDIVSQEIGAKTNDDCKSQIETKLAQSQTICKKSPGKPMQRAKSASKHTSNPVSQEVHDILRRHRELQMKRSAIMTHSSTRKLLKAIWQTQHHEHDMCKIDYIALYSQLIHGLTSNWNDELASSIVLTTWDIDSQGQKTISMDVFCHSMFFFVEQWVDEPDLGEYICQLKVFLNILRPGDVQMGFLSNRPTLQEYQRHLECQAQAISLGVALGKSMEFDPIRYLDQRNKAVIFQNNEIKSHEVSEDTAHHYPLKSRSQIQIKLDMKKPKALPHL
ncbi:hypothetical protein THRCLA_09930 [Thraustotheca clavata]|uniref:Uncharacterized protein n=1 Tax=Thraustotheca clavata TaxID=74557 RepID=A0A1V9YTG3_9STRA|nr:hypothetical protein THRCLA_09930 [Thraustotheca clavata]